jgi:hypothetical protein
MTPNKMHFDFEQLGPHDVLLGRGTGTNEYIGNVRFRETIRGIVDESGIDKFDGHVKTELARLIVARIKDIGGRFVKKITAPAAKRQGTGSSLEGVYVEVRDSVACDKVTQCIRHKLRAPKVSLLTDTKIPRAKKNVKARRPSSEANTRLTSKKSNTLPRNRSQQPLISPGVSSAVLPEISLHTMPGERSHEPSQVDFLRYQMQFSQANPMADSHALMLQEYLNTVHFPNISRRNHLATATPHSTMPHSTMDAATLVQGAMSHDQDIILKLLVHQQHESALLHDALIVRRNQNKMIEQWLSVQPPPLVASPLAALCSSTTLQALIAQELASHRIIQASSGIGSLHMATPL